MKTFQKFIDEEPQNSLLFASESCNPPNTNLAIKSIPTGMISNWAELGDFVQGSEAEEDNVLY